MDRMVSMTLMRTSAGLLALACAGLALPATAQAQSDNLVAGWADQRGGEAAAAAVLTRTEQEHYRQLFAAIDTKQWDVVESLLAQRPNGVLTQLARAEYYTHAESPKVSGDQIAAWLASQWVDAAAPNVPRNSGRVVKDMGAVSSFCCAPRRPAACSKM
jgi:hypothetical protein